MSPEIEFANCQTGVPIREKLLEQHFPKALQHILAVPTGPLTEAPLADLDLLEISVLDEPGLAQVHADFLGDPSPTDVITFPYGEILISADTAQREATARKMAVERELLLYIVHGLLHLHGYDDLNPETREQMHQLQGEILDQLWPPNQHRVS